MTWYYYYYYIVYTVYSQKRFYHSEYVFNLKYYNEKEMSVITLFLGKLI